MKKVLLIGLMFFVVSCSSIDSYLKDKNYININDNIKYRVIEKKEIKKEIVEEKPTKVIKETPIKNTTTVIKEEVVEKIPVKPVKAVAEESVTNKDKEINTKATTQLLNKLTTRVTNSNVVFNSEDEKIIQYISGLVIENETQIRTKTIDSINRLKEKGINLSAKEFLALAYKNIKDTRVNSYILAVARVMNNVERGKK